jgi:para-aminobenzoate synthetase component I
MTIDDFRKQLNAWGKEKIPFLFLVDFEMRKPLAWKLSDVNAAEILYDCNGITNAEARRSNGKIDLQKFPIDFQEYHRKFATVFRHLEQGDSYLTNLTIRTRIDVTTSLRELFYYSKAKYKLCFKDEFLVFSPEIFVKIKDQKIYSYPMKGTIDASLPSAETRILTDIKELSEHVTIVDLIRNDLSTVADHVRVLRFRYIDEIRTSEKRLLQVSSEIVGELGENCNCRLGDVLLNLLPAGSISGAPKHKTLEIIAAAENEMREYYTGVFGIFDGATVDSGVMIRFIERKGSSLYYRSGGGITTQSLPENEYQEAIDKVYVPID